MMKNKRNALYNLLKKHLTSAEIKIVPSSFDVIGSLLIFSDFPKSLAKKERIVGEDFLKFYPNIKTILKKTKQYSGKYRLPKYKIIAGEKTKETLYKENEVRLEINPEKVYFSSRLSNERLRIAKLVGKGEKVLVMFSGCGVYPLVISRNSLVKEVVGVEINSNAHAYGQKNIILNKINNVLLLKGDVKNVVPRLRGKFDRIVMPLPKGAELFLEIAFGKIRKKGFIHLYCFWNKKDPGSPEGVVVKSCKSAKKSCKIIDVVSCGAYSPGTNRYCVDFQMS